MFHRPYSLCEFQLGAQTRPEEALAAKKECDVLQKSDCWVTLVPRVGHAFSLPRGPRRHPLLDITLGPVEPDFQEVLRKLGAALAK